MSPQSGTVLVGSLELILITRFSIFLINPRDFLQFSTKAPHPFLHWKGNTSWLLRLPLALVENQNEILELELNPLFSVLPGTKMVFLQFCVGENEDKVKAPV